VPRTPWRPPSTTPPSLPAATLSMRKHRANHQADISVASGAHPIRRCRPPGNSTTATPNTPRPTVVAPAPPGVTGMCGAASDACVKLSACTAEMASDNRPWSPRRHRGLPWPYARVADGVGSAHGSETLLQHACARETPAAVHLFGNAHIIVHCPAPRQGATG